MNRISVITSVTAQFFLLCFTASADEGTEIVKLIQNAQRAGLEKHDIDQYMAIWAKDARIISGRSEKKQRVRYRFEA